MQNKLSPPPRIPKARGADVNNSIELSHSTFSAPPAMRAMAKSTDTLSVGASSSGIPRNWVVSRNSTQQQQQGLPWKHSNNNDKDVEEQKEGKENEYLMSELIIPFHLDAANRLMKDPVQSRKATTFDRSDMIELQISVDDYVEGLIHTTRQLFMHDNENMVQELQRRKDVSIISLFLQMQREMRQLTGDDSIAEERQLIEKVSSLLDV
ncbi:uncharacterized protein TM35_000023620 [Trypanosoma theileri]|uniref:Uncharacterized protein n=1 Tax=Trypanosoma theileri TaxID=67003 RepID=A0A1X0P7W6_9TRYP|nr:uncharacterized protein TM35_000023620 [Trypanosoma theileri]ORC93036.1 hypothetical protein TM35_000023620 [Trypanosoma theileri]